MREINTEELKKIQVEILDVMSQFCENHGIQYWLDWGTLLGAIRHKGYIPWDDDVDTGMLRKDYDIFMKLFNEENDRYKVYSVENDPSYSFPFAKIIDTQTVLYEPDEHGYKSAVYVDLFVYDNAPEDEEEVRRMFQRRDFLLKMRSLQWRHRPSGNVLRRALIYMANVPMRLIPTGYFEKKIIQNARKYQDTETGKIGNFTDSYTVTADKSIFTDFIYVEFEGKKYRAPARYDEWLHAAYGDYMQLPPVEKRVSRHSFKAYYLD